MHAAGRRRYDVTTVLWLDGSREAKYLVSSVSGARGKNQKRDERWCEGTTLLLPRGINLRPSTQDRLLLQGVVFRV